MDWCSRDPILWLNLFCWTYKPFRHTAAGKRLESETYVPFVTWPVQDGFVDLLVESSGLMGASTFPVCGDKSREMGASWVCLAVMAWAWLYFPKVAMLVASRKEEEVDYKGRVELGTDSSTVPGDPDTLLWKIDCLLHFLPWWMKPRFSRSHLQVVNLDNGSVINGESTNSDLGRGGRRVITMLDEAAAITNLKQIEHSLNDASGTVWYISTPVAGSRYSQVATEGKVPRYQMGWWDHPEKGGQGRYLAYDADMGKVVVDGPWRQREKAKGRTPSDIAMNVDIDHENAGRLIFDPATMRRLKLLTRPPLEYVTFKKPEGMAGLIAMRKRDLRAIRRTFSPRPIDKASWCLWCDLVRGRPDQDDTYVIGCDVSGGVGASNSVAVVYSMHRKQIVAELATASLSPKRFATEVVMAALWFGGVRGFAYVGWEANGVGRSFGRMIQTCHYPWYMLDRNFGTRDETDSERLGWTSNREKKIDGLMELSEAYQAGFIVDPSVKAIEEAQQYIRYENGGCGPSNLEEESADAQATHGDRVMARVVMMIGTRRAMIQLPSKVPPQVNSLAHQLGITDDPADEEDY